MEEFLKSLTEQIRCVKAREGVAHELSDHILDQAQAYEKSGIEHEKAVEMAVREMGDPVEIGVSLDRIHRPQIDWKMILLTFALSIAGLFVIQLMYGPERPSVFGKQLIYTIAGFAVIAGVNFVDYSIIGRFGYAIYAVLTIAFWIGRMLLPTMNGRVPAMSMLVYLYLPAFAGVLYRLRRRGYGAVMKSIIVIMATTLFVLVLSDSITVVLNIFLICMLMLIIAINKNMFCVNKKYMKIMTAGIALFPFPAAVLYFSICGAAYQKERMHAFFNPYRYETSYGYIYARIRDMLQGAKLIGPGTGADFSNELTLNSGLIPLQLIYSYGLIAGAVLLALFVLFVMRAMKIVRCQKNQLGILVSASCFLVITVNCLEGILMNMGLCPVTTVSIPFLTYGGSAALVYAVLIGLLMSVHRYEKVITADTSEYQPKWRIQVRLEKR